jgi:hypothetical protein
MNIKRTTSIVAGLLLTATAHNARAAVALVNFETTPQLSTGPSIYIAVPGPQTITTGPATFSGGVVLGFATFFPAIAFATVPNVYGTADFGNKLAKSLTIDVDPTFPTTEVSFALFNGEVFNQTYSVDAFNGANLVANQTLTNIVPNFQSGYGLVDVTSPGGITKVVITPTGAPSAYDFLIDTIALNQNITSVIPIQPPPLIPPPPTDPVQGHRHGHGEVELLEVNFGDDVNDIRGSTVPAPTPEPTSLVTLFGLGIIGCFTRRKRQNA